MDFGTMLAVITSVISVIGFMIGYYGVLHKRAGVAIAEPGQPYYSSTWDAVQKGEDAARANVWPEGVPDHVSDLVSALRPVLGPAERCPDCSWERIVAMDASAERWILVESCAGHAVWRAIPGRVMAVYTAEGEDAPLQNVEVDYKAMSYGITAEEAQANAERWVREMMDYDRRYRMEENY